MLKYSLIGLFIGVSCWGMPQSLSAKGGSVEFLAIGKPSFIKIRGAGSAASGAVTVDGDKATGKFAFDMGTLDTGIEKRNEHMKEKYLETPKFPKSELEIASTSALKGWSKTNPKISDADFNGNLTLHGVTKPVTGKFSVTDSRASEVHFKVKLSDYAITIPSFSGITVADEVEITVKIDKLD